ncbi:carbohydrate ABC transporter membrane protein 1, CUT1 family [Paraburkholderia fungorum]|uniref:Carbohydrate ABC transporter membrane protein 1, CUT1 family n=1 Tax=Paraburkholderia fungorum TaxID=134537 RepID=A0A1H1HAY5_9BURK|nr:sugar ABC transporter permease [Paraburkholderia fungorum]SDR22196.1 carbohydrate ABC transporter membrane protein 1, CUT1 family [Paraburkholderia fungorum]
MAADRSLTAGLPKARQRRFNYPLASWSNGLFVLPFVIVYVLLLVVPLVYGWWLSLQNVDLLGGTTEFIGIKNYVDLAFDPIFRGAVRNTFYFVFLTVPMFVALGLALALVLNRPGRFSAALRAIFFGSSVLSVTIVTLVWKLVLMPGHGLLADVSHALSIPEFVPLVHESTALPMIAVVTVWWIVGLPMMLFLAALQQIPQELYEAAALDNASRWRTFASITLPSIRRTLALVAVIEAVFQFQLFGQAQLLTDGGPNNASRPLVQFIYESGFRQWLFGYSAAAAQVLFLLMLIGIAVQAWIVRRKDSV